MRTTFSSEQIAALKRNPCVFTCTHNSVNYTYEFKQRALALHQERVPAREIWKRSGFNVDLWKKEYFKGTLHDWKKVVTKHGSEGLLKPGGIQYDRGPNNTDKDKLKRLELQVKYLEAENDFLAQLRAKRAEPNSGRIKNTESSEN
jgi:transposase